MPRRVPGSDDGGGDQPQHYSDHDCTCIADSPERPWALCRGSERGADLRRGIGPGRAGIAAAGALRWPESRGFMGVVLLPGSRRERQSAIGRN